MTPAIVKDIVAEKINKLHNAVYTYKQLTLHAMIEIGKLLCEEKHKRSGHFLWWLKENVNFSERTAHKYMRVYRLSETELWDKKKSVAENLAYLAEPQTFKQAVNQTKAEDLSRTHGVKISTAKRFLAAVEKAPELSIKPEIKIVNQLSENQKTKLRIKIFEAMERAYDLGKRNKLLSISEKRAVFDQIVKELDK